MPHEYAVAISFAGTDFECAAALYRRLTEQLRREDVYFHPVNHGPVEVSTEQLVHIYERCHVMAVLLSKDSSQRLYPLWEAVEAARRLRPGRNGAVAVLRRPGEKIPDCLNAALQLHGHQPIDIREQNWLPDVDDAAKIVLRRLDSSVLRKRPRHEEPPLMGGHVMRHLTALDAIFASKRNPLLLASVKCTAALLGTTEQAMRAATIVRALRRLADATAPELVDLENLDPVIDCAQSHAELLLRALASRSELSSLRHGGDPRARAHIPDHLQLSRRLGDYLRRHALDGSPHEFTELLQQLLLAAQTATRREQQRSLRSIHRRSLELAARIDEALLREPIDMAAHAYNPSSRDEAHVLLTKIVNACGPRLSRHPPPPEPARA